MSASPFSDRTTRAARRHEAWLPSEDQIIAFADELAEGISLALAARTVGLTDAQGRKLFAQMRADLGGQAI